MPCVIGKCLVRESRKLLKRKFRQFYKKKNGFELKRTVD